MLFAHQACSRLSGIWLVLKLLLTSFAFYQICLLNVVFVCQLVLSWKFPDRRSGSSISNYRKDEYNWRYGNEDNSETVDRASSALENLQLDRKARNLMSSWRYGFQFHSKNLVISNGSCLQILNQLTFHVSFSTEALMMELGMMGVMAACESNYRLHSGTKYAVSYLTCLHWELTKLMTIIVAMFVL